MTTFVVTINCLIALFNFYLAWKLWQWLGAIALFTRTLDQLEYQCHLFLTPTSETLALQQRNLQSLKQGYQLLTLKLLRLRQILFLLSWLTRSRMGYF